jgi:undecaprenyl-diphosphatase
MNEIIKTDKEIFVFLNNLGSAPFDPFWEMLSSKWVWIPLYIILLYLIYKNYKLRNMIFIIIFIALGIIISDQLAGIFKHTIARLRPCHDPSLHNLIREVQCGGKFGFYSSHASNTFLIATFVGKLLANKFKYSNFMLFFWAIMVSYSRIYLGVHFPLDIVMGAIAGFLLGRVFVALAFVVIQKGKNV